MTCQQVTGGFRCEANKPIIFNSPLDTTNPLTSHQWTIDGTLESTQSQFQKTYAQAGFHTVVHTGMNACGGQCTQTSQVEITAQPITPPTPASSAPKSSAALLLVGVIGLGIVGLVLSKS